MKDNMYAKLKPIMKLAFRIDDMIEQEDLFELQEKLAELMLEIANKEGKTEQLLKDFKGIYVEAEKK